jgi:hypothetical protein
MVKRLARRKASSYLGGSSGSVAQEVAIVAEVYSRKPATVQRAVEAIYPKILAKMAG